MDWRDSEPGLAECALDLRVMLGRVRRCLGQTLALALILGCALFAYASGLRESSNATLSFRVVEGVLDASGAAPAADTFAQRLNDNLLSRHNLLPILEDFDLYPDARRLDANLALERFREDLELEVDQDYFAVEHYREDPARSARFTLEYRGDDPDTALQVARRLSALIESQELQRRQALAAAQQESLEQRRAAAERRVAGLVERGAELGQEQRLGGAAAQASAKMLASLVARNLQDALSERQALERVARELALQRSLEESGRALRFEVIEPGVVERAALVGRTRQGVAAVISALSALITAILVVGAFGRRLWDPEGVRRLGLHCFGHVPSFSGMDACTWERRRRGDCEGRSL